MKVFAVILVVSLWNVYSAEEYVNITRKSRDVFKIPASMCSSDTEKQCDNMGGKQRMLSDKTKVNCTCHCNYNDTQNVFGFFDNTWKCERNKYVRTYAECLVKNLDGRTSDSPLLLVKPQNGFRSIGILSVPADFNDCYIKDQFSYLDCNSTWKQMDRAPQGFAINYNVSDDMFYLYHLGKRNFSRYLPKIYGHVIKLNIKCDIFNEWDINSSSTTYCVVLKVRGRLRCPIFLPTEHSIPTKVTTQSSKSHNITEPTPTGGKKSASTVGNGGMIAGAIGGVAVLVIIGVLLLIMKLRRKRNMAGNGTTSNRVDNNVYEQQVDNHTAYTGHQSPTDDEYTYVYTNNLSNNNTAFKRPAYRQDNDVDVPGSPPHGEAPVYNTLEDPDHVKLDSTNENSTTQNEPLYNVLENPETEDATYQGPLNDVLEGPNSSDASVYDVLERPESDEQHVYGSLEAQDPHFYGSLNSPNTDAGGVNRGFDDVLYDTAGDVIQSSEQGDIYQQLNETGQQSSDDVYQPLDYPRIAMNMNELPESSQSHA